MPILKYKKFQNKSCSVVHHISELEMLLAKPEGSPKNQKKNPKIQKPDPKVQITRKYKYLKHKYLLQIFNSIFILKLYLKISI